jgi:hypothetical protein
MKKEKYDKPQRVQRTRWGPCPGAGYSMKEKYDRPPASSTDTMQPVINGRTFYGEGKIQLKPTSSTDTMQSVSSGRIYYEELAG